MAATQAYASKIFQLLLTQPQGAAELKVIYKMMETAHPGHCNKNSIRHNLSMNKAFQRQSCIEGQSKSSVWFITSEARNSGAVEPSTRNRKEKTSRKRPTGVKKDQARVAAGKLGGQASSRIRKSRNLNQPARHTASGLPLLRPAPDQPVQSTGISLTVSNLHDDSLFDFSDLASSLYSSSQIPFGRFESSPGAALSTIESSGPNPSYDQDDFRSTTSYGRERAPDLRTAYYSDQTSHSRMSLNSDQATSSSAGEADLLDSPPLLEDLFSANLDSILGDQPGQYHGYSGL